MTNAFLFTILIEVLRLVASLPDFGELCPYIDICAKDTKQGQNDVYKTCCLPCSCSDTCVLTGTCCPDKESNLTTAQTLPCRTQKQIYRKHLKREIWSPSYPHYRIIDECSSEFDVRADETSVSRCTEAKELEDLIFVTSHRSGLTYLNEHCARCNHENNFSQWNIFLTMNSDTLLFSSLEERDTYILEVGNYKILPPPIIVAFNSICSLDVIGRCNLTGLWDVYNKELERKCTSHKPLFSPGTAYNIFGIPYANVYCFMCNYPSNMEVPKQCNYLGNLLNPISRTTIVPFDALIIPQKKNNERSVHTDTNCSSGQIVDPLFINRCTDLICPPATVPDNGLCLSIVDTVHGYGISIKLRLSLEQEVYTQEPDYTLLLKDLRRFINMNLRNRALQCVICKIFIARLVDDTTVLEFLVVSGEKCDYLVLLEEFSATYRSLPLTIFSNSLKNNVTLSYFNAEFDLMTINYLAHQSLSVYCNYNVEYTPKIVFCPSITFNMRDVSRKCSSSCFQTNIKQFAMSLGNGTYIICLDHYIQAFGLNLAYSNNLNRPKLIILILSYSIRLFK